MVHLMEVRRKSRTERVGLGRVLEWAKGKYLQSHHSLHSRIDSMVLRPYGQAALQIVETMALAS